MFGMGWPELAIIFVIILVIFGPKSLPKIGQSLGRGIREFKDAAQGLTADLDDDDDRSKSAAKPAPQVSQAARTVEEDLSADKQPNHTV
jgi:sec-independent protein translocase protein TatA